MICLSILMTYLQITDYYISEAIAYQLVLPNPMTWPLAV